MRFFSLFDLALSSPPADEGQDSLVEAQPIAATKLENLGWARVEN